MREILKNRRKALAQRALAMLQNDHMRSARIERARVCQRIRELDVMIAALR